MELPEVEQKIMDKIVEIHHLYIGLEVQHPSDIQEWVNGIHQLQNVMAWRILRRDHPDMFFSL